MKRILVTGVAGFIGARTAELLLNKNYSITGIDNLNDYYDLSLKKYRLNKLRSFPNFKFFYKDIEKIIDLKKIFTHMTFDAVINLAAQTGVRNSLLYPQQYISTNVIGTINLLEMMKKYSIKKFVFASSSSVYAHVPMPFSEDSSCNSPYSPYAASKINAELICYSYFHLFHIDISILRYFTAYGPAGRPDMSIFRFIKSIDEQKPISLYGKNNRRNFTYIDDIANATIKSLKKTGYEIFNISSNEKPRSLISIIHQMEKLLQKKAIIKYYPAQKSDMKYTWANISKAKRILHWTPKITLDEGLTKTIEWYFLNKSWLKKVNV